MQELKCYIDHDFDVLLLCERVYGWMDWSLFPRGVGKLEQTVISLKLAMVFLKVAVGMRKIATLTMEKTLDVVQL